nr:MAG TPA: hypothetical protein [Caudoviricetes sp.]
MFPLRIRLLRHSPMCYYLSINDGINDNTYD